MKRETGGGGMIEPPLPAPAGKIDVILIQIFRISQSKRFALNHRLPMAAFTAPSHTKEGIISYIFK